MKLNNKGFAITAVLYGLLILFVVLFGSYMTMLGTKKNRVDNITSDIEGKYDFNTEKQVNESITYPYKALYTGKYTFTDGCSIYLFKGNIYEDGDINCTGNLESILYHGDNNE